jgi:hypothetical protein
MWGDKKFIPNFVDETFRMRTTWKARCKIQMAVGDLIYERWKWTELVLDHVQ